MPPLEAPLQASPSTAANLSGARLPLRLFSRELAVLLAAGVPLLEALTTLREKEDQAAHIEVLGELVAALEQGLSFSQALAQAPGHFDELFIAVISAAEHSGEVQRALQTHAQYLGWVEALRAKLWAACVYPLLLVVASVAVLTFLLVHVVPRFAALLEGMQAKMSWGSHLLLQVGAWAGAHPALTIALAVALLVAPVALARAQWLRSPLAAAVWRTPQLGSRLRLLALARLYRTLGMLLNAGVPLVPALQAAQGVVSPLLRPAVQGAAAQVAQGQRLSIAMDEHGLSTPVSARMVRVGERSGELGPMLDQAAAFYDEELTRLSELFTNLITPALMLIMGSLIGAVIVLLYLPIFELAEQVQ